MVQECVVIVGAHSCHPFGLSGEYRAVDGQSSAVVRAVAGCGCLGIDAGVYAERVGHGIGGLAMQEVQQVFHGDLHQAGGSGSFFADEGCLHFVGCLCAD